MSQQPHVQNQSQPQTETQPLKPGQAERPDQFHSCGTRVVISPEHFGAGAPMEVGRSGVRDLKVIYPETGFEARTLCFGIVEVDPGHHSPLHQHNCEELYYVLQGEGEIEYDGERFPIKAGDSTLQHPEKPHRVFNNGTETIRLVVVAGIMLVPLLASWPTPTPYTVHEPAGTEADNTLATGEIGVASSTGAASSAGAANIPTTPADAAE